MKNILLFVFSLAFVFQLHAQNQMVVRLDNAGQTELKTFNEKKLEITAYQEGVYIDAIVSPEKHKELIEEGFNLRITQTEEKNKAHLGQQKDIDGYRTYDEVLAELQQIAIDYPEICTLTDIGDSHGKEYFDSGMSQYEEYQHDIWMLKISDNVNETEDEPAVYYMGAHHAREPISTEVVMGLINHLLD